MQRRAERRSVSIKTCGVDPRRVDRATSVQRVRPQGQTGRRRCVGETRCRTGIRAKEVACDSRSTVEAGSPVRVAAPGKSATWQASAEGDKNLKRGVRSIMAWV